MEPENWTKKHIEKEKRKSPIRQILWGIVVVVVIVYGVKFLMSGSNIKEFIFSFGQPLTTDSRGYTNFVLMGTGGELHEGADLTDSIIVASLNAEKNSATLLSLPRDLYVETKVDGQDRINKVYTIAKNKFEDSKTGLETMEKVLEDVMGTEIQYYIKINFDGFEEVIDAIDGVDIYVETTIDDPFYPKEGTIKYEPFYLPSGMHHLDGETALKYARSRKTSSDFDRSYRQQKLLFAIRDRVAEKGIVNDSDKIKDIFLSLKENIETDLSIREMISLSDIAKEIKRENIKTYILHDDPSQCGGFLYTPERDLYGGAFVLIPASDPFNPDDNYEYLHFFLQEVIRNHEISHENIRIQILNGTQSPGLAAQTKVLLQRHCFDIIRYGNAQNLDTQKTKLYAKTESALNSETLKTVREFLGTGETNTDVPQKYLEEPYISDAEIIIELGRDYAMDRNIDPFDYLVDILTKEAEEDSADENEDTAETENEGAESEEITTDL